MESISKQNPNPNANPSRIWHISTTNAGFSTDNGQKVHYAHNIELQKKALSNKSAGLKCHQLSGIRCNFNVDDDNLMSLGCLMCDFILSIAHFISNLNVYKVLPWFHPIKIIRKKTNSHGHHFLSLFSVSTHFYSLHTLCIGTNSHHFYVNIKKWCIL